MNQGVSSCNYEKKKGLSQHPVSQRSETNTSVDIRHQHLAVKPHQEIHVVWIFLRVFYRCVFGFTDMRCCFFVVVVVVVASASYECNGLNVITSSRAVSEIV